MAVLVLLEGLLILSALRPWTEVSLPAPSPASPPAPFVAQAAPADCVAALRKADELLAEADAAHAAQDLAGEAARLAEAARVLLAHPAAELGAECIRRLEAIGKRTHVSGDLATARAVREAVVAARPLALPAELRELQRARHALANTLSTMGDLVHAQSLLEDVVAVSSRERSEDDVDVRQARMDLAKVLLRQGDFPGGRAVLEAWIASLERLPVPEELEHCHARSLLAMGLRDAGEKLAAKAAFESLLPDLERLGPAGRDMLEAVREELTWTLIELGQLQAARDFAEGHLAELERELPADHPFTLECRMRLAQISTHLGDLQRARALEEGVLAVRERTLPESNRLVHRARLQLGGTLYQLGDLRRARELMELALTGFEATLPADHPNVREARMNYAAVLYATGDIAGARALQEKLLAENERSLPEDHRDVSFARMNLAITLQRSGDYVRARALLEAALAVQERVLPEENIDLQRTRQNLARILKELGNRPAARMIEEHVLRVLEKTVPDDNPDLQIARHNLGETLMVAGDVAEARRLFEKYLEVGARTMEKDHPELQVARLSLAQTLGLQGDLAGELAIERDVLDTMQRTGAQDDLQLCTCLHNLISTLVRMGDADALAPVLAGLSRTCERVVVSSASLPQRETAERLSSLDDEMDVLLSFDPQLPPEQRRTRSIFALLETLRATATDSTGTANVKAEPALESLLARAQEASSSVAEAVTGSGGRIDSEALLARIHERDEADAAVRKALEASGKAPAKVDPGVLANALAPDAAAVGFHRYRRWVVVAEKPLERPVDRLVAFVVRPSSEPVRVELGPWAPVARAVERWRAVIGKPIERGLAAPATDVADEARAGEELRRLVLDPLLPALGDARHVHVCPDDSLHLVQLEALPFAEGLVGDRWRVHVESSFARLVTPERARSPREELVVIGGVGFNAELKLQDVGVLLASAPSLADDRRNASPLGTNWDPLPQTRAEAEGLAALFEEVFGSKPVVLTGAAATKKALREQAPSARYLHISTHGYFAPDSVRSLADRSGSHVKISEAAAAEPSEPGLWTPLGAQETAVGLAPMTLCGLALAGANRGPDSLGRVPGILTAEELARFDLSGCELAVLSACETNVGATRAGQGISSLRAALHAAGARTAITSLWKVDDEATRALFADFYARIWVHHEPKAEALWNAMMALRREGRPTRDWAAWVMTGDPR